MLVLMVTMGCQAECAHCFLGSDNTKLKFRLSKKDMNLSIKEARKVGIQSVVFTGGEPTFYLNNLYEPMELARDLGMYVDLRTNGYWAKDIDTTWAILNKLQVAGLHRVGLSHDNFHAVSIPPVCAANIIQASQNLGIETYLDWLGNETREDILSYLQIEEKTLRLVGPPLRVGRAIFLDGKHPPCITLEEIMYNSEFSYSCGHSESSHLLLTIMPEGYAMLHSCCWLHPILVMQRTDKDWLSNLVQEASRNPATIFLHDYGLQGLAQLAYRECPSLLKPYYSHQCELCFDLLGQFFQPIVKTPSYLTQPREKCKSGM